MTTWQITLENFKGERKTFSGFGTQAEAEDFAHQQVSAATEWETAFFPATKDPERESQAG